MIIRLGMDKKNQQNSFEWFFFFHFIFSKKPTDLICSAWFSLSLCNTICTCNTICKYIKSWMQGEKSRRMYFFIIKKERKNWMKSTQKIWMTIQCTLKKLDFWIKLHVKHGFVLTFDCLSLNPDNGHFFHNGTLIKSNS